MPHTLDEGTLEANPVLRRYMILATDGLPNCGPELPDGSTRATVDETVAAIGLLRAAGINTYLLGFGSGLASDSVTNTITFYGAECTRVQSGDVASIDVDFGCPGPLISADAIHLDLIGRDMIHAIGRRGRRRAN